MTNSPEAIAAAREIVKKLYAHEASDSEASIVASIIQKHYAAKDVALEKINVIRNSIIAFQSCNFSEHVYPLVATLNEAGLKGMSYPDTLAYFGPVLERANKAEAERDQLKARVAELEKFKEGVIANAPKCGACAGALFTGGVWEEHDKDCIYSRLQELERKAKALDWLLGFNTLSIKKYIPPASFDTQHFVTLSAIESAMEKQK